MTLPLVLAAALLAGGAPNKVPAKPAPPPPAQEKTRLELATEGYRQATAGYLGGVATIETVTRWAQWLFEAEQALNGEAAREKHLARLRDLAHAVEGRVQQGTATQLDLVTVRYLLATASERRPGPVDAAPAPEPARAP